MTFLNRLIATVFAVILLAPLYAILLGAFVLPTVTVAVTHPAANPLGATPVKVGVPWHAKVENRDDNKALYYQAKTWETQEACLAAMEGINDVLDELAKPVAGDLVFPPKADKDLAGSIFQLWYMVAVQSGRTTVRFHVSCVQQ